MEQSTNIVLTPSVGSPCKQREPNPCAVPLAKRGEPAGGGYTNEVPLCNATALH
jgi:hypothetical protein